MKKFFCFLIFRTRARVFFKKFLNGKVKDTYLVENISYIKSYIYTYRVLNLHFFHSFFVTFYGCVSASCNRCSGTSVVRQTELCKHLCNSFPSYAVNSTTMNPSTVHASAIRRFKPINWILEAVWLAFFFFFFPGLYCTLFSFQ